MTKQFILLIEDSPDDQELIIRALRKRGIDCEITVAQDGVEALEFLFGTGPHSERDLAVMPALILLDLQLPRLDGLDVLRRVRAHRLTRHLPVVLVTGAWNAKQIFRGIRLHADGFISKANDFKKLTESLGKLALDVLLDGRRRDNRARGGGVRVSTRSTGGPDLPDAETGG